MTHDEERQPIWVIQVTWKGYLQLISLICKRSAILRFFEIMEDLAWKILGLPYENILEIENQNVYCCSQVLSSQLQELLYLIK